MAMPNDYWYDASGFLNTDMDDLSFWSDGRLGDNRGYESGEKYAEICVASDGETFEIRFPNDDSRENIIGLTDIAEAKEAGYLALNPDIDTEADRDVNSDINEEFSDMDLTPFPEDTGADTITDDELARLEQEILGPDFEEPGEGEPEDFSMPEEYSDLFGESELGVPELEEKPTEPETTEDADTDTQIELNEEPVEIQDNPPKEDDIEQFRVLGIDEFDNFDDEDIYEETGDSNGDEGIGESDLTDEVTVGTDTQSSYIASMIEDAKNDPEVQRMMAYGRGENPDAIDTKEADIEPEDLSTDNNSDKAPEQFSFDWDRFPEEAENPDVDRAFDIIEGRDEDFESRISWSFSEANNLSDEDKSVLTNERESLIDRFEVLESRISTTESDITKAFKEYNSLNEEAEKIEGTDGWEKDKSLSDSYDKLITQRDNVFSYHQELTVDIKEMKSEVREIGDRLGELEYKLGETDIKNFEDPCKLADILGDNLEGSEKLEVFEGKLSEDWEAKIYLVPESDTEPAHYEAEYINNQEPEQSFESPEHFDYLSAAQYQAEAYAISGLGDREYNEADTEPEYDVTPEEKEAAEEHTREAVDDNIEKYSDAWMEKCGNLLDGKAMMPPRFDGIYGLIKYADMAKTANDLEACGLKSDLMDYERMKWNGRANNIQHTQSLREDLVKYRDAVANDDKEGIREFRAEHGDEALNFSKIVSPENKQEYLDLLDRGISAIDKSIDYKSTIRVMDVLDKQGIEGIIGEKISQAVAEKYGAGHGAVVRNMIFGAHPNDWANSVKEFYKEREAEGKSTDTKDAVEKGMDVLEKIHKFEENIAGKVDKLAENAFDKIKSIFTTTGDNRFEGDAKDKEPDLDKDGEPTEKDIDKDPETPQGDLDPEHQLDSEPDTEKPDDNPDNRTEPENDGDNQNDSEPNEDKSEDKEPDDDKDDEDNKGDKKEDPEKEREEQPEEKEKASENELEKEKGEEPEKDGESEKEKEAQDKEAIKEQEQAEKDKDSEKDGEKSEDKREEPEKDGEKEREQEPEKEEKEQDNDSDKNEEKQDKREELDKDSEREGDVNKEGDSNQEGDGKEEIPEKETEPSDKEPDAEKPESDQDKENEAEKNNDADKGNEADKENLKEDPDKELEDKGAEKDFEENKGDFKEEPKDDEPRNEEPKDDELRQNEEPDDSDDTKPEDDEDGDEKPEQDSNGDGEVDERDGQQERSEDEVDRDLHESEEDGSDYVDDMQSMFEDDNLDNMDDLSQGDIGEPQEINSDLTNSGDNLEEAPQEPETFTEEDLPPEQMNEADFLNKPEGFDDNSDSNTDTNIAEADNTANTEEVVELNPDDVIDSIDLEEQIENDAQMVFDDAPTEDTPQEIDLEADKDITEGTENMVDTIDAAENGVDYSADTAWDSFDPEATTDWDNFDPESYIDAGADAMVDAGTEGTAEAATEVAADSEAILETLAAFL